MNVRVRRIAISVAVVALALLLCASRAFAQQDFNSRLRDGLAIDPAIFRQFFTRLQSDLQIRNREAVCAAVRFPLRMMSGVVRSAAQCVARFDTIFDADVVHSAVTQAIEDLWVAPGGVMVGRGEMWISYVCPDMACQSGSAVRIIAVRGALEKHGLAPADAVLVSCATETWRFEVSGDGQGGYRLRQWPASATPGADSGIGWEGGTQAGFGTSGCSGSRYHFTREGATVDFDLGGCYPESNLPPPGAEARLTREAPGASPQSEWCMAPTTTPDR